MTREDLSVLHIECAADALTYTAETVGQAAHEVINNPTVRYLGQTAAEEVRSMCEEVELDASSPQDVQSGLMLLYLKRIRNLEGTQVARRIGEGILMLGLAVDMPRDEVLARWRDAKSATRMDRVSDERLWRGLPSYEPVAA